MKYGIIVFNNTENIGDDIQSYAAYKLLPKVDYYVEREHIDTFFPNEKEYVKVIMNGWFMHYKHNFIPSPYIDPLFISTHFSSYDTYGISNEWIKENKNYLNKYTPIGCRDKNSKKILDSFDIDSYVSGCITLTLDRFKIKKSSEKYICCVDVEDKITKHVEKITDIKVITKTHKLNSKQNTKLSYEERFNNVEKLLKLYQNAKLVITSRLHCALPCIAIGTPVILIKDEKSIYYNDRINSFLEYLNYYSEEEFLNLNIKDIFKIKNSNLHLDARKNLLNKVAEGIKTISTNTALLPEINVFKNLYVNRKKKIDKLLDVMLINYKEKYNDNLNNQKAAQYWEEQYNMLLKNKDEALKQNDDYWKKQFNDLLKDKELAVKINDDYWRKEYNQLLDKLNNINKE